MRKIYCAIATIALACGTASAAEPTIDTIAGGGTPASGNGDGGQARQAKLFDPHDVALDAAGNLYIAEPCRIRKVTPAGVITTFGGDGTNGAPPAEGAAATSGSICSPTVAVDPFGNVWFYMAYRIGKIDAAGNVAWVAGTGALGFTGDGGPATSARISQVEDIALDAVGNAYFTDYDRVRRISTNGIVDTFAGGGGLRETLEGVPATLVSLLPTDLFVDASGDVFIVEETGDFDYGPSVRKVDATGTITRLWGAWPRFATDPIARYTKATSPTGVVVATNGNLLVSTLAANVALIGTDSAIDANAVGTRIPGFAGDGGPASQAQLNYPKAIAIGAQDTLYIADAANARVRKVTGAFAAPTLPTAAWMFRHATDQRVEAENQKTIGIVKGHSNADHLVDLFVLAGRFQAPGAYAVYAYRQQPDGTMAAPLVTTVPSVNLTDVMATDLDHDAYTDIVFTATDTGAASVFVMRGGPGGLAAPVGYTGIGTATNAVGLDQADMNGDGNMDVLVRLKTPCCTGATDTWAIYYGNGTGALGVKKTTPVALIGTTQVIGDFNGDHRPDMLMSVSGSNSGLAVAYHDSGENFQSTVHYLTGQWDKAGDYPVVGDFDGDKVLDIVTSLSRNSPNAKLMQWSQTANGFAFKREWSTYDLPEAMIAADMNFDGRDDLVIKHDGWDAIGYQQQVALEGGAFGLDREVKTYMEVDNQSLPHSFVVGDFNNDHCLDIAGSGSNSGLQIIYSTRCNRLMQGAKPPLPPRRPVTDPTPTITQTAVSTVPAATNDSVWVASQKFARAAWRATFGSWSNTARWIGGSVALLLFGWWVLPASGLALGRRRF